MLPAVEAFQLKLIWLELAALEVKLEGNPGGVAVATGKAQQLAVVPPLDPLQLQDQGVPVLTAEGAPTLHRFAVGAVAKVPLSDDPQAPFTATEFAEKVAVTDLAALIVTVQLPVPKQAPPDHPANVDPAFAFAVKVIVAPEL